MEFETSDAENVPNKEDVGGLSILKTSTFKSKLYH